MPLNFNPRIRLVDQDGYLTREAAQMLGLTDVNQGFQEADATLTALAALGAAAGLLTQTAADSFTKRTLQAPVAGLTITHPAGTSGDPTFALANDLAALEGISGTGFAARTTTDTWTVRTLTAPAAGITISDGDGVSGNPTLALANDLAALEGLSGTGFAVRSASDTWVQRSITGSSDFTITNGDGVSANPSVALSFTISAFAKTLLDDADAATARATLGVASASAWELVDEQTLSAVADYTLTGLSTYRMLRVTGRMAPVTDGTPLLLRTSTDNGVSYDSGASDYDYQTNLGSNTSFIGARVTAATSLNVSVSNVGAATGEEVQFELVLTQFNQAAYLYMDGRLTFVNNSNNIFGGTTHGRRLEATARDAFQLLFASGNIASGYVLVEGRT